MSRKGPRFPSKADRRSAAVAHDVEALRLERADVKAQLKTLTGAVVLQAERLERLSKQRGGRSEAAVKSLVPPGPAPVQPPPAPARAVPQVQAKPFDLFADDEVPYADAGPSRWGDYSRPSV